MKDEIKEILNKLRSDNYYEKEYQKSVYYVRDLKKLEDCITNLQEEVNKLTAESTEWESKYYDLQKENEELKNIKTNDYMSKDNTYYKDALIYKSRNEKAIDKIQYIIDYGFDYDCFNTVESLKGLIDMLVDYARQSKDILKGDKDE